MFEILNILNQLKLTKYIDTFKEEGINDINTFNDYEDDDLLELGLKKPHIKRLRRYFEEYNSVNADVSVIETKIEKQWFELLSEDNDLWVQELLNNNVPVISHEYNRIKKLLSEGQYFGALLQIKDFFEILLKLPTIIILNEKFNLDHYSDDEKELIITTLEKPLSLGHWHEIVTIIRKHTLCTDAKFSKFIINTIKLYNKNDIIKWRNDEIGHGALSLDDDSEFQQDIKDKLLIIKNFLDNNISILLTIEFDKNNNIVKYGKKSSPVNPFFQFVDEKVYFFDSYLSRKQKVHQLNYCYGKKLVSEVDDFTNFMSQHEMDKRDNKFSSCSFDDVRLAEEEKQLDLLEQSTEFIKPKFLIEWIENSLDKFSKGKFLLQMQRGTGKSLFCKALDQLALNKIELDSDILVRSYYINDFFRSSLSDFTSEISYFILNKELSANNFIDKFKGNLPTLSVDSSKSDFTYLLNWYKQKYDVDKLLLIIDGVDEIPQSEEKTIFDILPEEDDLDDGIYLLVTSRTDKEITNFTKDKLAQTYFEDKKIVEKDSLENIETLKSYIDKYKLASTEIQIDSLIQKSDYRILYLNMLKEIIISCKINIDDIPENEKIIEFYLEEVKKRYGEKYFQTIFYILIILASQLEELTIKEIAYLNNDASVSLKLIANLFDLRGFVKKTRDVNGSLFSLNHISLVKYINKAYLDEILGFIINSYKNIQNFSYLDESDIYKMAYLEKYEEKYKLTLSLDINIEFLLSFLIGIDKKFYFERSHKIAILLVNLLLKEMDSIKMIEYLNKLDDDLLSCTIESKMKDNEFIEYIIKNIDNMLEMYDETKYVLFKAFYINFYKYDDRKIAFNIIYTLIKKHEKFEDILNYISMCKGDSKWMEASQTIDKYLHNNNFNELQLAQFYYIVGRMYVDDIKKFHQSKNYLKKSISLFNKNNQSINQNIAKNTLSMYYFSNGEYKKAYELLLPICKEVMEDNGINYDQNAIESIYNNMFVYSFVNNHEFLFEELSFLNKEIELYYQNTLAVKLINDNEYEKAERIFNDSIENAIKFDKNYAKAALLYNYTIYFNNNIKQVNNLVNSKGYTMGSYIIENKDSNEHVLNTINIDDKHFWLCVKNVDLLL